MKKCFSPSPLLFCLIFLFGSQAARAQYRFDHWSADNGLPQNSVRDIVQTSDGYLWFTTFDGLVRFDGVRFTVFNKSNSPGLPSNRFFNLFEDRQGDLWSMLETGEVVRRHQGRFITYTHAQGLQGIASSRLGDDGQGNVVIYYMQYRIDEQKKGYSSIAFRAYRWSDGHFQPAEELSHNLSGATISAEEASKAFVAGVVEGDFWVLTTQRVIRYLKGGGVQVYNEQNGLPGTLPRLVLGRGRPLQLATRDAAGRLWLTDLKSMHSQLLSLQTPEGFEGFQGYADNEGNYWFSSFNAGLFRARRQTVTPYGKAQGLDVKESYPLLEGHDGALWIGTGEQGVFRLKDGAFTQYAAKIKDIDSFNGAATSLYEDRAGKLWVNGFWRLVDGRFVRAPWVKVNELLNDASTMYEDRAGAYWFGRATGVARYQNGAVTQFTTKDGLAGLDTKLIIGDGQGGLWLGSYGGLTHYKDGKFTAWTAKDGLPGNTVRALKQDDDGTLWIGTYDSGLGRFKDGRFTRYTTEDGLFDNGVFQILEDDYGWMWMSCNRGIYRVRKQELNDFADGRVKTLTCLAYNKNDGMPSSECNGGRWPAGVKASDGKLWFPTMGGVAMIDPASITANKQPPPVVIEAMRINNKPAPFDAWDSAIHNPQSALQIKPGQDNFEIEYTALSFINSENLRFRYRMEGADEEWVEAGTRRTAYYSHLAPGDYTFKVIAANSDGVWNMTGASVRIGIVPPFYRTWWFLLLVVVTVSGALWLAFRYRIAQLRHRNEQQQMFARQLLASQEDERKRIAVELHDSLGQNLLVIKNRALLNAISTADEQGRTQFTEFSDAVSQTLEEVRLISQDLRPPHLDQLGLRTALVAMIEKVAASSTIRFAHDIGELDRLFPPGDEILIYRIVQESLSNILKHSGATQAEIRITVNESKVVLAIHDNGRGFTPDGNAPGRAGLGLQSIAERARILGGMPAIHSTPGQGTTIMLRIAVRGASAT